MNIDESDLQVMRDYLDDLCEKCDAPRQLLLDEMREAIDANPEKNPASDI